MQQHPTLILGTAMWGWTIDRATCFELLDFYYGEGFREVDGATNYPINKSPADFRLAETILQEWINANGITDLRVMMKVGSLNNMRTPDHNLRQSFLLLMLDEYRNRFGSNLHTYMIHWDNRNELSEIEETYKALAYAEKQGLVIGLSGIRHPELHAEVYRQYQFPLRIQIKHNLLQSDYQRYKEFHAKPRFITYGINAGGLKLSAESYHSGSSLKARGGNTESPHPIVAPLNQIISKYNQTYSDSINSFNQCGMAYAFHSPDIQGILIGSSNTAQLEQTIEFHHLLKEGRFRTFYNELENLASDFQNQ